MTKVVLNRCYGGFAISEVAQTILGVGKQYHFDISKRTDEKLITLLEVCGSETVSGYFAKLEVVEYDETKFTYGIREYDGCETLELIPIVDVPKISQMSANDIRQYLDELGIKHN